MADFDVKKEAAWAISNATSGGTPEQIRYLVTQQCIRPLCDLLTVQDSRIINVALEVRSTPFFVAAQICPGRIVLTMCTCWWQGIENILKLGEEDKEKSGAEMNDFSRLVEEADGMDKLETLQSHANDEIYQRAVNITESYFGLEDEVAEDGSAFQLGGQGVQ